MPSTEGRIRVVVEGVRPEIDCGAFPAKRIVGDRVVVEADIFTDGHDLVAGEILYRHRQEETWRRRRDPSEGKSCECVTDQGGEFGLFHGA